MTATAAAANLLRHGQRVRVGCGSGAARLSVSQRRWLSKLHGCSSPRRRAWLSTTSSKPDHQQAPAAAAVSFNSEAELKMRKSATEGLATLQEQAAQAEGPFTCWVTGESYSRIEAESAGAAAADAAAASSANDTPFFRNLTAEAATNMKIFFDLYGFLAVPNFVTAGECDEMLGAMSDIVDTWDPSKDISVFTTSPEEQENIAKDYFLQSGNKVVCCLVDVQLRGVLLGVGGGVVVLLGSQCFKSNHVDANH